jgi:CRP/FNR family transcriptional regulator
MRELCLPQGLRDADVKTFEKVVYARRRIKRGETLFATGDEFKAIYSVRSGFFKTSLVDGEGREQVTGFSMAVSTPIPFKTSGAIAGLPRTNLV